MNNKRVILILFYLLLCFCIPVLTHAKIAFKSKRDGSKSLYVMDDDGRNVQRLTTESVSWPVWSPNGKQIVFSRSLPFERGQGQKAAIFLINSDGTEEHQLTDGDRLDWFSTWSPDGKLIAFDSSTPFERTDIWTINIETKELRRLTRTNQLTVAPSWSPDGKYIAYREGFKIYLMRADGSRQHELWPGKGIYGRYLPRWSADSQSLLYIENSYDAAGKFLDRDVVIHSIEIDKRQVIDTPDDWSIHSAVFMGEKHLLIAAKVIVADPDQSKYDIYKYDLVTGDIVNLTNNPTVDDFAIDWISDDVLPVSPQGKKKVTWGEVKH